MNAASRDQLSKRDLPSQGSQGRASSPLDLMDHCSLDLEELEPRDSNLFLGDHAGIPNIASALPDFNLDNSDPNAHTNLSLHHNHDDSAHGDEHHDGDSGHGNNTTTTHHNISIESSIHGDVRDGRTNVVNSAHSIRIDWDFLAQNGPIHGLCNDLYVDTFTLYPDDRDAHHKNNTMEVATTTALPIGPAAYADAAHAPAANADATATASATSTATATTMPTATSTSMPATATPTATDASLLPFPQFPPVSLEALAAVSMAPGMPVLGDAIALDQPMMDFYPGIDFNMPGAADMSLNGPALPEPQDLMHAFARLRFNDGNYYMHTYSIILGRNVELAREDILNLKRAKRAIESANADGLDQRKKRKRRNHRPRSVVSNTGGIVNISAAALPAEYQQRRPSVASNSHDSSSNRNPASNPDDVAEQAPQDILMEALDPLPTQLGTRTPQDPHECPIVPIHPQNIRHMTNIQGPKGISRKHAKIAYNFDERYFELEVFSRNGLYHEDVFYSAGHKIRLNHGDTIVIGAVDMTFTLPDEALTEEDRARNNRSSRGSESRPMSFAFENGNGELEDANMDDEDSLSEGTSVNPRHIFQFTEDFDSDVDHLAGDDDGMDEDEEEDLEEEEEVSPVPRRKKHKHIGKPMKQKLKVKLKLKSKHIPPPPRKEVKAPQKRKHVREPSPVEPPFKRPKKKIPEPEQEPVKEKEKLSSKIPAKAPVKSPIKDVPRDPTPEKPEPEKTPTSQSPTLTKKTIPEGAASMEDGEQGGIITAELAKLHGLPPSLIGQVLEKRKGPGRPPKDGLISKRQKALLVKEGKRIEQARKEGRDVDALPALPIKPKIARPRKESTSNPGEGDDDDIRESTEAGDGAAGMGDKKPSKPNKPPRTPSPELRIEDYTEEQLQRPSANYVVLIHEAISSSNTGQMNLQQIYTYIEKKYPWYKFKTTTSGWQSSVRHNLGQHDAFVKGDKEGKGYNWKINPDVSIEKERRKRQVSPTVSHSQRPGYYPQHTGYPAYGQPPTPYYSGIPPQSIQGVANGLPRPPPSVEQPRLPPSLQRNSTAGAAPAAQTAPNPSPYSSPWAGGNPAGSPVNQNPPRPYPPSHVQTPPVSSTTTSTGQYGVLMPTTGSQGGTTTSGSYQSQYATAGASPYASGPTRTYSPYATAGSPSSTLPHVPTVPRPTSNGASHSTATPNNPSGAGSSHAGSMPAQVNSSVTPTQGPVPHVQASTHNPPHHPSNTSIPRVSHPSGRYPVGTDPLIIAQLEGFRQYYLEQTELDRDLETVKVDNAYKALFNPAFVSKLTKQEADLLDSISGFVSKIPVGNTSPQEGAEAMKKAVQEQTTGRTSSTAASAHSEAMSTNLASTAAAIAAHNAAAAASNETKEIPNVPLAKLETSSSKPGTSAISPGMEPHKFTPSMVNPAVSFVANGPMAVASSPIGTRPSVEPLTPVPGSPAVGIVPLMKQALAIPSERDLEDAKAGAAEPSTSKPEASVPSARPNETPAPKTE